MCCKNYFKKLKNSTLKTCKVFIHIILIIYNRSTTYLLTLCYINIKVKDTNTQNSK